MAEWRIAETKHFLIYSDDSKKDIIKFAERLERIDKLMRMANRVPDDLPPVKVRVFVVDDMREVQEALGRKNSGVAGFYTSNSHGPFAVVPRRIRGGGIIFTPETVLFHEYAHHFMLQYTPSVYPSWYIEGFAELVGSTRFISDDVMAYGWANNARAQGLYHARSVPASALLLNRSDELPDDMDFYGRAWLLTHYLTFSEERQGQLEAYLRALEQGRSREEAATVFGDLDALDREVARYLRGAEFPAVKVEIEFDEPVVQNMRPLSEGEAALVTEMAAFRDYDLSSLDDLDDDEKREDIEKRSQKYVERVRRKAAYHPQDPHALRLLADAEYVAGNYQAANRAADRLLAADPDNPGGMLRKGMTMLKLAADGDEPVTAETAERARRWIIKANRADPDDPQPLIAYYKSFLMAGENPPEIAVAGLIQAVQTAFWDFNSRWLLAEQLISDERIDEAIAVLAPIAYAPHRSSRQQQALEKLNELQQMRAGEQADKDAA
ncbi:MAG: hypothetical protein ACFBQW_09670 [Sphingomonadaceae bacterium]